VIQCSACPFGATCTIKLWGRMAAPSAWYAFACGRGMCYLPDVPLMACMHLKPCMWLMHQQYSAFLAHAQVLACAHTHTNARIHANAHVRTHMCTHAHANTRTHVQDFERGSLYGLEKFWAFHHYCGLPCDSDIQVNPRLKSLLQVRQVSIKSTCLLVSAHWALMPVSAGGSVVWLHVLRPGFGKDRVPWLSASGMLQPYGGVKVGSCVFHRMYALLNIS